MLSRLFAFSRKIISPRKDDKGVHLSHCYQGEYKTTCKYGDLNCPAKRYVTPRPRPTPKPRPKNKKEIIVWADDDWMICNKKELKQSIIEPEINGHVFHYKKAYCYEGKPRKVKITIEEI